MYRRMCDVVIKKNIYKRDEHVFATTYQSKKYSPCRGKHWFFNEEKVMVQLYVKDMKVSGICDTKEPITIDLLEKSAKQTVFLQNL